MDKQTEKSQLSSIAYLPSITEMKIIDEKFPAFSAANISESAKKEGVKGHSNYNNQAWFYLRSLCKSKFPENVYYAGFGGRYVDCPKNLDYYGLRFCIALKYDSKSSVVKNCKNVSKTSKLMRTEGDKVVDYEVTSQAPVVNFAGLDYVWMNKEECENGKSPVMKLITLEVVAKSVGFDKNSRNYIDAKALHSQCFNLINDKASADELNMIVETEMSISDGFESLKYPSIEKMSEENRIENEGTKAFAPYSQVDIIFKKLEDNEITIEKFKQELNEVMERVGEDYANFSVDELYKISSYIGTKYKEYQEKQIKKDKDALDVETER